MSATITRPPWCTAQDQHAADLADGESIMHMSADHYRWLSATLREPTVAEPEPQVMIHADLAWFTLDDAEAVVEEIHGFASMLGASPSPETRSADPDTFKSR